MRPEGNISSMYDLSVSENRCCAYDEFMFFVNNRFFTVSTKNGVEALTREFDLGSGVERVRVVAVTFQIFRCMSSIPLRQKRIM